jgi:hypothetical protein
MKVEIRKVKLSDIILNPDNPRTLHPQIEGIE